MLQQEFCADAPSMLSALQMNTGLWLVDRALNGIVAPLLRISLAAGLLSDAVIASGYLYAVVCAKVCKSFIHPITQ